MFKYLGPGLSLSDAGNLYCRFIAQIFSFIRVPPFLGEHKDGLYHPLLEPSGPTVQVPDSVGLSIWALAHPSTRVIIRAVIAILKLL